MNCPAAKSEGAAGAGALSRQDPMATAAGADPLGVTSGPSGRCVKAGQREASAVVR
jgi:hypothetical protein